MLSSDSGAAYLSHIGANLSRSSQELKTGHPLLCAEPGFSGEIMEMVHQPLEDVLEALVGVCRIDRHDIFSNVVNSQVLQRRNGDL